eukprot:scaffold3183_cov381-Prasinococcus_capsulatus_cf.AAC.32
MGPSQTVVSALRRAAAGRAAAATLRPVKRLEPARGAMGGAHVCRGEQARRRISTGPRGRLPVEEDIGDTSNAPSRKRACAERQIQTPSSRIGGDRRLRPRRSRSDAIMRRRGCARPPNARTAPDDPARAAARARRPSHPSGQPRRAD